MNVRDNAKLWLKVNHPEECDAPMRASKYYQEKDIWFFTFPASYFDSQKVGHLNMLLQFDKAAECFHFLKVPFSFFRESKDKFDIRKNGDKFDLHISAKKPSWLMCERSKDICFSQFEK